MPKARILIVDDEEGMLEVCAATLKKLRNTHIRVEQDSRKAAELIESTNFDLIFLDIKMPGFSGVELLQKIRKSDPNAIVLMMTAFATVETAVECMKLGAADFITKPFLPEDLLASAQRLLESKILREENVLLQRQLERTSKFGELIGNSQAMQTVFETIKQVAKTNVDVLILGKTGTGKELVARSIHQHSPRSNHRIVPVDCGAIPEDLLESELFGHERGAFTGAHVRTLGLLEFADQGTFFLDEIGELPKRLQAKLLRTLQERKLRRVGGKNEIEVDVRVVSATSRDLDLEVKENRFRSDLYYRINVARVEIPALKERREDIPLLLSHFINRYAPEMDKQVNRAEPETIEILTNYDWPGNVRELQNVVKRSLTVANGDSLTANDLPDDLVTNAGKSTSEQSGGFFDRREQQARLFEQEYLLKMLQFCKGDITRAAQEAQVPRGTFYRFLKKHDLNPDDYRD